MDNKFVLIADPIVMNIPIQENGEPLVDLREQTEIQFGPSPEIENNQVYTKIRESVYLRLKEAQRLLPEGTFLCLYEGLRTVSLQQMLFDERKRKIQTSHPHWSETEIYTEVIKMVSPVMTLEGIINIPPHSTGAAVDVYLVDRLGRPLEMGILTKDWAEDVDGKLSLTHSTLISEEAKKNRAIQSKAMTCAGFVNYPTEYWHWAYGDRYWAFEKKRPFAFYNTVEGL